MCNCEDVSKKREETGKSCSEHRRSLLSFLLLCARPGEARRTLWVKMKTVEVYSELSVKVTSEKTVDVFVDYMYAVWR